jgi:hypothetical protein
MPNGSSTLGVKRHDIYRRQTIYRLYRHVSEEEWGFHTSKPPGILGLGKKSVI